MAIGDWAGPVLQAVGLLTGILALADWSLTDRQKGAIKGWAETAWIWLNDRKVTSYLSVITSRRAQRIVALAISALFVTAMAAAYLTFSGPNATPETEGLIPMLFSSYVSGIIYLVWLHPRLAERFLRGRSPVAFGIRLALIIAALYVGAFVLTLLALFLLALLPVDFLAADSSFVTIMVLIGISVAPSVASLFSLAAWAFWVAAIFALLACLRVAEFVTFRIASYEKGPVLGLSAVVLAIGLIIKPFA